MSAEADKIAVWLRWEARERYAHAPDIAEAMERAAQCVEAGEHRAMPRDSFVTIPRLAEYWRGPWPGQTRIASCNYAFFTMDRLTTLHSFPAISPSPS